MSKLVNVRETEGEIKNGQSRETNNKTQDEGKQTKTNVAHYVLDTTIRKQTQITSIRHEPSYKQHFRHFHYVICSLWRKPKHLVAFHKSPAACIKCRSIGYMSAHLSKPHTLDIFPNCIDIQKYYRLLRCRARVMVFNATFKNIPVI